MLVSPHPSEERLRFDEQTRKIITSKPVKKVMSALGSGGGGVNTSSSSGGAGAGGAAGSLSNNGLSNNNNNPSMIPSTMSGGGSDTTGKGKEEWMDVGTRDVEESDLCLQSACGAGEIRYRGWCQHTLLIIFT